LGFGFWVLRFWDLGVVIGVRGFGVGS
jgi:hypothetical protein